MLLGKLCRFFLKNLAILSWLEGLCRENFAKLTIPAHLHRGPDDDWIEVSGKMCVALLATFACKWLMAQEFHIGERLLLPVDWRVSRLNHSGCCYDRQYHGSCKGIEAKMHFDIRHGAQPYGYDEQRGDKDIQHGPFSILCEPMKNFHVPSWIMDQTIHKPKEEQELKKRQYNAKSENQDKKYRVTFR